MIALVILAAGESSRLGRCKALVPITPRTPLDLLLDAGAVLGGPPPIVVSGPDHESIAAATGLRGEVARNRDWSSGRSGGVLLAARRRPGHDLCIAPVDVPLVPAEVFEALSRAWHEAGSPSQGWAAPFVSIEGRPRAFGHPVLIGRALALRLAELGPAAPLRELRCLADPLLAVAVASPAILDDLDEPGDLEEFQGRSGP
ncbi:MAG: NTP transferase domain-containing protein [Planctomycetota bacterium]